MTLAPWPAALVYGKSELNGCCLWLTYFMGGRCFLATQATQQFINKVRCSAECFAKLAIECIAIALIIESKM